MNCQIDPRAPEPRFVTDVQIQPSDEIYTYIFNYEMMKDRESCVVLDILEGDDSGKLYVTFLFSCFAETNPCSREHVFFM